MSCTRNRGYRIREANQVRCFCVTGHEKVWYLSWSNRPNGAWDRIARETTLKFEEASHPIFNCSEPSSKGDLKSKKGKQTIHFLSTTQRNKSSFVLFWHATSCVFASRYVICLMMCHLSGAFCDAERDFSCISAYSCSVVCFTTAAGKS